MTPSKVTKKDLEALVSKANEFAKEMGLTLSLDASKITFHCAGPDGNIGGTFNDESGEIGLNYRTIEDISSPDLARSLVHEGAHKKYFDEIDPFCYKKDYAFKCAFKKMFIENLGYAVNIFFDNRPQKELNSAWALLGGWIFSPLAHAMAKACKNGMPMDEIFEKVREYSKNPAHHSDEVDAVDFAYLLAGKLITKELGFELGDFVSDWKKEWIEKMLAKEASAQ